MYFIYNVYLKISIVTVKTIETFVAVPNNNI